MKIPIPAKDYERAISDVCMTLLCNSDVRKATKFVSDSVVVAATARHRPDKRRRYCDWVVKVGKPNFVERRFIRLCKQAGEPLPVKKVRVKRWKR
jgi:hypothetical protein